MKKDYLNKAICRLSSAIQYLTWAIEAETNEGIIEWTDEAVNMMQNAEEWIEKSDILPF